MGGMEKTQDLAIIDSSSTKHHMLASSVSSDSVTITDDLQTSLYKYEVPSITVDESGSVSLSRAEKAIEFQLQRTLPKMGVMMVGWGGNNGTTVTAGILANKHHYTWREKTGERQPNFYGSVSQCCSTYLGEHEGSSVFLPISKLLPMVDPTQMEISGWDISNCNMAVALERAQVLEPGLQDCLREEMSLMVPLPGVFNQRFVAKNQADRATHTIDGTIKHQLDTLRRDIQGFKAAKGLDKVVVLWTANTECYAPTGPHNATAAALLRTMAEDRKDLVSPSTIYAVACILEGVPYLNGSPQNTFVPGVLELARLRDSPLGGDDFKSGQTKMKSALAEFIIGAGMRLVSIASYNHLGNNDGKNLSSQAQFRSKEISKASVVDDMIRSNPILYPPGRMSCPHGHQAIDHTVVIKYMPYVGDSKRAMDEYTSEIFLGGRSTIALHNTCEDSLLAAPLIVDLLVIGELLTRVSWRSSPSEEWQPLHPVLSSLSYFFKAPLARREDRTDVVNALNQQRMGLENFLRALAGLPQISHFTPCDVTGPVEVMEARPEEIDELVSILEGASVDIVEQ
eukprot:gnl/Dysnectes_brevis/475_a528_3551.p1 GENE.gnl/Dysnectes_brevis/475_a528_3551~~gnl/Dysnectes_brevis/475_a528_3551.p1  ORF type:complete len:568 (-),score=181.53 gnl/Dysnectes_brevis/475_a528_3551:59-1762(-)